MRTRRPPTTVKSYACTCHVPSHTLAHTNVIECQHRWYLCLDVYGHVRRCQPTRTVPARIDVQTETHTHRITLLCMGLFFIIFRSIWLDIRYMYNIYIWYIMIIMVPTKVSAWRTFYCSDVASVYGYTGNKREPLLHTWAGCHDVLHQYVWLAKSKNLSESHQLVSFEFIWYIYICIYIVWYSPHMRKWCLSDLFEARPLVWFLGFTWGALTARLAAAGLFQHGWSKR